MRNEFKSILLLVVSCVLLSAIFGCKVKTYSVVRERPDRDTYGNRGYLMGAPEDLPAIEPRTRKTYVIEVETATPETKESIEETTKEESAYRDISYLEYRQEEPKDTGYSKKATPVIDETMVAPERTYVVKDGDSLEKISLKFYGKKAQWNKIFEANKDKLKSPDKILPGQVLIIP